METGYEADYKLLSERYVVNCAGIAQNTECTLSLPSLNITVLTPDVWGFPHTPNNSLLDSPTDASCVLVNSIPQC